MAVKKDGEGDMREIVFGGIQRGDGSWRYVTNGEEKKKGD